MVRTVLTALLLSIPLLSPKVSTGEETKFVVVNRVPQFQVTNKVAPALPTDPNQPAPDGYRWVKRGDGPWKLERVAPEVAVPKGATFRDKSHNCPACGRSQYTVDGFNRDGTHRHRCPVDGTVWGH